MRTAIVQGTKGTTCTSGPSYQLRRKIITPKPSLMLVYGVWCTWNANIEHAAYGIRHKATSRLMAQKTRLIAPSIHLQHTLLHTAGARLAPFQIDPFVGSLTAASPPIIVGPESAREHGPDIRNSRNVHDMAIISFFFFHFQTRSQNVMSFQNHMTQWQSLPNKHQGRGCL
jgi:hypothetical protein